MGENVVKPQIACQNPLKSHFHYTIIAIATDGTLKQTLQKKIPLPFMSQPSLTPHKHKPSLANMKVANEMSLCERGR